MGEGERVCLTINTARVSYETVNGETLIINLESGNYYSLLGTGAEIWSIVERGTAVDEILDEIGRRYAGDRAEIEAAVNRFVADLQSEALIVYDLGPALERTAEPRPGNPTAKNGERVAFQAPVLNKYTDMQDLLLLDPIHEVDEAGWPAPKLPSQD